MIAGTTTIRKGYVDVADGQVHYLEVGQGAPIMFLHQSPSSSRMWEPALPAFAKRGYRAIAIDYPGFGESYKPAQKPDLNYYLKVIVDSASALGVDKFYAIGHHTGATFVVTLADQYPERLIKGVGYGIAYLEPQYAERLANEAPTVYSEEGAEVLRPWTRYWSSQKRRGLQGNTTVALRNLVDVLQLGENSGWAHNVVGMVDHETVLKRITRPVLLVGGEFDRGLLQPTRDAGKILKTGRYVDMPGVGGDVYDEAPEAFADLVDAFFREP